MSLFGAFSYVRRFLSDTLVFCLMETMEWSDYAKLTLAALLVYAIIFVKGMNRFQHVRFRL